MEKQIKNRFRDEIRNVLILHALTPILLCVIAFLAVFAFAWNYVIVNAAQQACEQSAKQLENTIEDYKSAALNFSRNIQPENLAQSSGYAAKTAADVYDFLNKQPVRGDFYLLDSNGDSVYTTASAGAESVQLEWNILRLLKRDKQEVSFLFCRENNQAEAQIGVKIMQGGSLKGYVVFVLKEKQLTEYLTKNHALPIIVTDRFNRIFLETDSRFHDDMSKLSAEVRGANGYINIADGRYYIFSTHTLSDEVCVYAVNESLPMQRTIVSMILLGIVIFVGIFVAICISARVISVRKTSGVEQIVAAFKGAEYGDLETHLTIETQDEFAVIANSYNMMVDSLRNVIERNKEQVQRTVLARIKQLESQLNPHFLFNTLENVRFMIRLDPKAADHMIRCLSELLRYSIKTDADIVPLSEELRYTENYLAILNYRFGNRVCCKINVPPELKELLVPRVLLQPLIENSVKHGLGDKPQLTVSILAEVQGSTLLLTVSDDGVGIPHERLLEVQKMLRYTADKDDHVGVHNVHHRLRLMFGDGYGLSIDSAEGCGTVIEIRMEVRSAPSGSAKEGSTDA